MSRKAQTSDFRRAPEAPSLPAGTFRFILHRLAEVRWWLMLMVILETGQAASSILVPYAIKEIMDGVAHGIAGAAVLDALRGPLLLFAGLSLAEVLFSRASGAVLVIVGPRFRQRTAEALYAYLQHHSVRYFSERFAGALAHRISETAMSVNHTVWSILFDFWPVAITFAVSATLLFRANEGLGWFVAGWVLVFTSICYWLATRCQPYAQAYAATRSTVNGKIVDSVTNILSAKLFARLKFEREHLHDFLETEVQAGRRTFWYMERVRWFQFTASALLKVGTVGYALLLWDEGLIGAGDFAMAASLALLIIS